MTEREPEPVHGAEPDTEFEALPSTWEEQAVSLADAFISPREPTGEEHRILTRFAHLCLRFAHMEHRIQGDVLFDVSAHPAVIRGDHDENLLTGAEELAAAEREILEIPEGPIDDLSELLDDRGIKIIEWTQPPGNDPSGAFLFDGNTGPALLALAPEGSPAGRLILAHEYCHLIADVDPYENRFCPAASQEEAGTKGGGRLFEPDRPDGGDRRLIRSEIRADLFARAFLLPAEHFLRSLRLFEIRPEHDLALPRVADLALYYGVEPAVVLGRLVDLGILPPEEVRSITVEPRVLPGSGPPDAPPPAGPADFRSDRPERFVNLGLAMFLKHLVSLDQLATLLGIDRDTARQFLAWCDLPPSIAKAAKGADPPETPETGRPESRGTR
ncbi:MAG: ImmA/IrrE family metallo-endopeptidase [Candidatus Eisenbacteria sp.]|nr:ImmA/IrrE family metallo-endopeptidase [Candidatus Eisenbacteria bacterium]